MWMDFGSSQNQSYFLVHAICNSLRAEKSKGLLFFHAFPGCDQTSFFENCRKKSTWGTWCNFDEVTEAFIKRSSSLTIKAVTTDVWLDAQLSWCHSCCRDLFVKKGQEMEALPLTFDALLQHSFHAAYQARHV